MGYYSCGLDACFVRMIEYLINNFNLHHNNDSNIPQSVIYKEMHCIIKALLQRKLNIIYKYKFHDLAINRNVGKEKYDFVNANCRFNFIILQYFYLDFLHNRGGNLCKSITILL